MRPDLPRQIAEPVNVTPGPEWWELPTADPERPMLPDQAARFLQMRHPDPVRTLLRWARDNKIKHIHVGRAVMFTLATLREHAGRDLGRRPSVRMARVA